MYNESKEFNIIGLIVKIIIIIIFALLALWLISRVVNKASNNAFTKNMDLMKNASIDYFKDGNLPENEGDAAKVTLGELIKGKYINSFDKKCNRDDSYSQATLIDDYYALRVELLCGKKKKYIYTSIDKEGNCIGDNCGNEEIIEDKNDVDDKKEENNNNNSNNNNNIDNDNKNNTTNNNNNNTTNNNTNKNNTTNNNNNNSKVSKTLYYEYVKVNKVYSGWSYTKPSGSNYETKQSSRTIYRSCKIDTKDYYIVAYYSYKVCSGANYNLRVKLNDIPSNTSNHRIITAELFNNNISMYSQLLQKAPNVTFISGSSGYNHINNATTLRNVSLKSGNLSITNNKLLTSNGIITESYLTFRNCTGISTYKNNYYVPVHYKVDYVNNSSCKEDYNTYNGYKVMSSKNVSATMYRTYSYKKDWNNTKWSTSTSLDGYEKTGKTEYR